MRLKGLGTIIVLAALGAAMADAPAWALDLYSLRIYPAVQGWLTPLSNRIPLPLFDLLLVASLVVVLVSGVRGLRRSWRGRSFWPISRVVAWTIVGAAFVYLWFLFAWGFNYRRPGVEAAMPGFAGDRAT